jgi:MoaA/NifB/PqqE/SkfB family radical SAM enzyme
MIDKTVDFYCSEKFTWLSLDFEKRLSYSCCKAQPDKIDISWLKKNSGQLFNTDLLKSERQHMLENTPVKSCHTACRLPESQGFTSRRLQRGQEKTHIDINASPETLNIILGSSCNLTCSYCCKQYSTAWLQDVENNGGYIDSDRFTLLPIDKVLLKVSQNEHRQTDAFDLLIAETKSFSNLKEVYVTGGEPFLYNGLCGILENISQTVEINLYTGLGINHTRLHKQLNKIKHIPNLKITVSAENINEFYEFNRYGSTYKNFEQNLKLLIESGLAVGFNSVISNLTVFGLADFVNKYKNIDINYDFCHDPDYLGVHVLDNNSKEELRKSLQASTIPNKNAIIQAMTIDYTQEQQQNFSIFVKEFARRRNLDLKIFPNSMLQWLNHVV